MLLASIVTHAVKLRSELETKRLALVTCFLYLVQLGVGVLNLLLLAPIWLQLVHLLMADLTWIATVLFTASALALREVGD